MADTPEPPTDGSYEAMEQMANWVRFADNKATILTAGLAAVLTMLMASGRTIVDAFRQGPEESYVTGSLCGLSLLLVCYTLFWLVRAIVPQRFVGQREINRFAWPTLVGVQIAELSAHVSNRPAGEDAWQQVLDLAILADRKFLACARATGGFAALVIVGIACLASAIAFTS